jgi:hypothetical protein
MLIVVMDLAMPSGIDIPRVIRKGLRRSGYVPLAKADGLHLSRTHSSRPDLSGLAQGGRNGIWDVMRTNINNVRDKIK